MKKRIVSLAVIVALIAIMLTSFTMAYFTDETDVAKNVMVFGKVGITLNEQMYDEDGKLVAFDDDNIVLMPAVLTETPEHKIHVENKIDKIVSVTAADDSQNAYVRILYAYEGTANEFAQYIQTFVNETNWDYNIVLDGVDTSGGVSNGNKTARTLWIEDRNNNGQPDNLDGFVTIAEAVYVPALEAGKTTEVSLKGFFLAPHATAEGVAEHFEDSYEINVIAQAVQAEGFAATADKGVARNALDEAFGNVWDLTDVPDAELADWFGLTLVTP